MTVANTSENAALCTCPTCPSYNECMGKKEEKLFCARGKTTCEMEKNGCICPDCPVYSEYRLDRMYYCSSENGE